MLIEDLHTHTRYSHGLGTVEQNVRAALLAGLKRIGIAEHGPKHLFFPVKWGALKRLRAEVDLMNSKYSGRIEVLMGLEANLLGDGLTDVPSDTSLFDYILLGYHKGTAPADKLSRSWARHLLFRQADKYGSSNAKAYEKAMEATPKLLAITHPGTYIPVDIELLAKAASEHSVALEINNSHRSLTKGALIKAKSQGAKFLLSSDAHSPSRVGNVLNALALAKDAGVLEQVINWAY
ncbi:MAG: putative hydrolase [Firmicutes bacterium ADurb.Bin356]|nr:MAG: putative hydrolase [Firmicutes bacterium ADurb.Bin356]